MFQLREFDSLFSIKLSNFYKHLFEYAIQCPNGSSGIAYWPDSCSQTEHFTISPVFTLLTLLYFLTSSRGTLLFSSTLSFISPKTFSFVALFDPFFANFFNSEQNSVIWFKISLPPFKFRAENVLLSLGGFDEFTCGSPNCWFFSAHDLVIAFFDTRLVKGWKSFKFESLFSTSSPKFSTDSRLCWLAFSASFFFASLVQKKLSVNHKIGLKVKFQISFFLVNVPASSVPERDHFRYVHRS